MPRDNKLATRLSNTPQRAPTIWISGLSAAGKSTLAGALQARLYQHDRTAAVLLDGEALRRRLPQRYGHTLADREQVLDAIIAEAARVTNAGDIAIVATISHTRAMRARARHALAPFMEVYLDCPAAVCARRDRKGHYQRALAGEYACFIGITHAYEPPHRPELRLDTAQAELEDCVDTLVRAARQFVSPWLGSMPGMAVHHEVER